MHPLQVVNVDAVHHGVQTFLHDSTRVSIHELLLDALNQPATRPSLQVLVASPLFLIEASLAVLQVFPALAGGREPGTFGSVKGSSGFDEEPLEPIGVHSEGLEHARQSLDLSPVHSLAVPFLLHQRE